MKRILTAFLFIIISAVNTDADDIIQGKYCYTHGDNESLVAAKELTRTLAIRNAIENYRTYVVATSTIQNFTLTNDIVMALSSGYLKNIKSMDTSINERTICDSITATVNPEEITAAVKREYEFRSKKIEERGVDNNGVLKILRAFLQEGKLYVIYEVIDAGPRLPSDRVKMNYDVRGIINVLYLSEDGQFLGTDRSKVISMFTDNGIVTTEIFYFPPPKTTSYKIFLYK